MALLHESGHQVALGTTRTLSYATVYSHVHSKDNDIPHVFCFDFCFSKRKEKSKATLDSNLLYVAWAGGISGHKSQLYQARGRQERTNT